MLAFDRKITVMRPLPRKSYPDRRLRPNDRVPAATELPRARVHVPSPWMRLKLHARHATRRARWFVPKAMQPPTSAASGASATSSSGPGIAISDDYRGDWLRLDALEAHVPRRPSHLDRMYEHSQLAKRDAIIGIVWLVAFALSLHVWS